VIKSKLLTLAVLCFIFIIQTASVSCTPSRIQADRAGNLSKSLTHGGLERVYHVHIPSSYRNSMATPLVVALHGGGGNGQKMATLTRLSLLADQNGFIVAYPEAVERNWNDGRGLSQYRSQRENIDDEIKGGGHTWPGGYQYLPEFLIGKTNRDLNASETIWNFFNGYRR